MTAPHGTPFTGKLGWGNRPAVLVVDMVRAYTEPGAPFQLPHAETVVSACARLVAAARDGGHPVLWSVVRYAPGTGGPVLWIRKVPALAVFAADAPGNWGEIAPGLAPRDQERIIVKQYASAFTGTDLSKHLTTAGIDTLVICGVSTSGCVRATATDAIAAGFRPQVVAEACGDRSPAIHDSNLADLGAKYADITDLDEATHHLG